MRLPLLPLAAAPLLIASALGCGGEPPTPSPWPPSTQPQPPPEVFFGVLGTGEIVLPETELQAATICRSTTMSCVLRGGWKVPLSVRLFARSGAAARPELDARRSRACTLAEGTRVARARDEAPGIYTAELEAFDGSLCVFSFPSAPGRLPVTVVVGPEVSVLLYEGPFSSAIVCGDADQRPGRCELERGSDAVLRVELLDGLAPGRVAEWRGSCRPTGNGVSAVIRPLPGGSVCFVGVRDEDRPCRNVGEPEVTLTWSDGEALARLGDRLVVDRRRFEEATLVAHAEARSSGPVYVGWLIGSGEQSWPMGRGEATLELAELRCEGGRRCTFTAQWWDGCPPREGALEVLVR